MDLDRTSGSVVTAHDGQSSQGPVSGGRVSDTDLHPDVAALHHRVDASEWEDIYVVGDVHGCYERLRALLDELDPSDEDLVVFVGDLVRKGPDSRKVVELVRDSANMLSVRGNNEQKVVDGRTDVTELDGVESYIDELPVVVSWDDQLVVHGGVDPRHPLREQGIEGLLNTRAIPPENGYDGPFWFDQYEGPPRVFFGHTVLADPVLNEWAVGLDTGCVYGGALTAYDYYADEVVSVPGSEHQERADRKIISPTDD